MRWVHPVARVGVGVIVALVVAGLVGPSLMPAHLDEFSPADRLKPPSWGHPFGTDTAGRDMLARVVVGARISLMAAAVIITLAASVGSSIGLVAGFLGGRVAAKSKRVADDVLSVPPLVL